MSTKYVEIPSTRARCDWGVGRGPGALYYRHARVEPDGSVLGWDNISDTWTRRHDLTEAEIAEARKLAAEQSERRMAAR